MRAMGFKGLEIVGGEFPRYMVKTGELMPFGKLVEPSLAKVGIVRRVAEVKKEMFFKKEVRYTPSEYVELLVGRKELAGIKEVKLPYPVLGRYRYPSPTGKPFKPSIEIQKGLPSTVREPVIRHELIHHLYPKLPEAKVKEEMFKFKQFKEIEIKKEPIKIEYYDFLEKGVSAEWIKKVKIGVEKPKPRIKIGKKAQIQIFKPKVEMKIPKVDVKPIFGEAFMKAQERAIRKAYDIATKPRARPISLLKQRTKAMQRLEKMLRIEPITRVEPISRAEIIPRVNIIQRLETIQRTRATQRLETVTKLETVTRITPTLFITPRPPPPLIIPLLPPQLRMFKKLKKPKKGIRRLRYQPSLVAVAKGITGRRPKFLTGIGIRPVLK